MRKLISLAATSAALLFPSRSQSISIGKIALIGMLVTTFFLFTAAYNFPGGASHYPNWALAIVNGTTLPPSLAQREVGFPLLYILSGFTFTHSFIGLTVLLAVFAVLMSVLVYWALAGISPTIAYYTGLACILSLSPYTYLKFFYPDQAYMFFNLLAVTLMIKFIQSKNSYRLLYLFTVTALAASFIRTAGNLMFPTLLVLSYIMVRGKVKHYAACVLIFAVFTGLYQWHRYEVFDMANQKSVPSGKGMQILYSNYLYLGDFGVKLSPEFGPNTKLLIDKMKAAIGPDVRTSPLLQKRIGDSPEWFMEKNFFAFTPEQLLDKVLSEPNEEYYWNLVYAIDTNDQFFLSVAKEIMISNPMYVLKFTMRNMKHALFDPGYATTRYNTLGYGHVGNDFVPSAYGWGTHSEDPVGMYGQRAVNEMKYNPITTTPGFIKSLFKGVEAYYQKNFQAYVRITTVFILAAWIAALLGVLSQVFTKNKFLTRLREMGLVTLTGPIIIVSALVVYEDLLTSMFCQPVYRYFHLTEPLRLVVVGLGAAFLSYFVMPYMMRKRTNTVNAVKGFVATIQKRDLISNYFAERNGQWILFLISLNVVLFAWWVASMLANT